MEDFPRLITQYLHVLSGLMWLGAGFYTIFVQTPGLMAAPAAARGAVLATLAPKQVFYSLRLGEFTILTGFLRIFTSGRSQELNGLTSRWAISIAISALLAIVLLVIGHRVLKPGVKKVLDLGPKAAQGDQAAAAEVARIVARFKTLGFVQIVLGLAIVFGMVLARLS